MIDFKEIVGHKKPVQILKNLIKYDRIGHAYLFEGQEGIGKRMTAVAFSKAINCIRLSENQDPCNECPSCLKIEKRIHPDFQMISTPDSVIKIDQIREIKRNIFLQPLENKKKIYLIDNAERMTAEAANSLLKILEEPPEFALLLLITGFPEAILPTILSRCSQLSFKSLSLEDQRKILQKRLTSYHEEDLERLIRLSYGRPGEAMLLSDDKQKMAERDQYIELLTSLKPGEMSDCLFRLNEKVFVKILDSFLDFINLMILWFRDILFMKIGINKDKLIFQRQMIEIQNYARFYSKEKIISILTYLAEIPEKLEKHVNPKILLENIFIQLGDE